MFLVRLAGGSGGGFQLVRPGDGSVRVRRAPRTSRDELDLSFRRNSVAHQQDGGSLFVPLQRGSVSRGSSFERSDSGARSADGLLAAPQGEHF